MKGDYMRMRKRNYRGVLMDVGLSLMRLFNGYVFVLILIVGCWVVNSVVGCLMIFFFKLVLIFCWGMLFFLCLKSLK